MRSQVRTQHANNIQSAATHTRSRKIRSRAGAIAFVTLPPAPSVLPRSLLLERGNAGPLQPRKEWERMEPRALRPEAPAASLSSSGQAEGSTAVILEDSAGREHDCGRLPSKCRERRRPRSNPRHLSQANQFFLHRRSPSHPLIFPLLVLASGSPFVFLSSLFWSYASRRRARGARPSEVRSCGAPFASPSWAPSGISSCFAPIRAYTQARRPLLHALRGWGGTGVPDLSQPIKLCPPSERHFRLLLYR